MSKFTLPEHFGLRSKSSADLRIKGARNSTVIEISSIPSSIDLYPHNLKSLESTGSRSAYKHLIETINSPKDTTHISKKSNNRSMTKTASIVPHIPHSISGEINLPSFRRTTIESLGQLTNSSTLRKEIYAESSPIEESRNSNIKADATRNKLKEVLKNKSEVTSLANLQTAIETVTKTVIYMQFSQARGLTGDFRKQALDNMQYIEKLLLVSAKNLVKLLDTYKVQNEEMKVSQAKISAKFQDLVQNERKLVTENRKLKEIDRKQEEEINYYEVKESTWRIERARLETVLEDMSSELQKVKPLSNVKQIYSQFEKEKSELSSKVEFLSKDNQKKGVGVIKLEFKISQLKEEIFEKTKFVNEFDEIKSRLENKLFQSEKSNETLRLELSTLKEQLKMLGEEYRHYIIINTKYKQLKQSFKAIRRKYQFLELNVITTLQENKEDSKYFANLDDPIFEKVRRSVYISLPHTHNFTEGRDLPDLDTSFDLSQLKLPRPSFAAYLDFPSYDRVSYTLPYENWLEVTIRGILDSKYYEHQIYNSVSGRCPSRFPEFVYSWFGNFIIDYSTKTVKELEWWRKDKADEYRKLMLYALAQESSKRVWEVNTFREFLMEELMLDELGFYLHCRFLLFDGPQLSHSSARYLQIHYVELGKVFEVVNIVMSSLPHYTVEDLKETFKDRSKKRGNVVSIEYCFVLRVLLEYYRHEKTHRYRTVKDMFKLAFTRHPQTESKLYFTGFAHVCKNLFPTLSDIQIAKFYRDVYAMTDGVISADAFFVVANESSYLYYSLQLKSHYSRPIVNTEGNIEPSFSPFIQKMQSVYQEWLKDSKDYEIVKETINGMGVSEIKQYITKLESLLSCKSTIKDEEYQGWNLLDVYRHLWLLVSICSTSFFNFNYQACNSLQISHESSLPFSNIRTGCKEFVDTLYTLQIKRLTNKIMIRKIQKNWRERAKKNLNIMTTVVKGIARFKRPISRSRNRSNWLGIPVAERS